MTERQLPLPQDELRAELEATRRRAARYRAALDDANDTIASLRETIGVGQASARMLLGERHELCDLPGMKRCVLVKGHGGSMCVSNSGTMWTKGMR